MNKNLHVVIMAGGSGTRFWPYSRNAKPKQFLDVLRTGRSLLQMTFDRFRSYAEADNIWVVSNEIYKDTIKEQIPEMKDDQILLEPVKRNTAPCIAYAAYKIREVDPDAVMVVTPSDHAIFRENEFIQVIDTAVNSAFSEDKLITIGIEPNRPETGYGYIQYIEADEELKKVKTFTEKPDRQLAKKFIESGDFVWNAGIFVWSISSILKAFQDFQPEMAELFEGGKKAYFKKKEKAFIQKTYAHCKSISIDYAVMENARNVFVVLGDFGWSDLGSWDSLHDLSKKDDHNNVVEEEALLYASRNNYIKSSKNKLLVVSDMDGYLIADFEDVLLICKKDDATKFKNFVNEVKATKGEKYV